MDPARKMIVVLVSAVLWTASAFATPAQTSGAISGVVHDRAGKAQSGAVVEIFSSDPLLLVALQAVVTDTAGRFTVTGLHPGAYVVKVSAPAFIAAPATRVTLANNAQVLLRFTLNTIFDAESMLPSRKTTPSTDDDWRWTLRSAANRPVLRVFQNTPPETASSASGTLAFMAGSGFDGLGGMPSVSTNFTVDQPLGDSNLLFNGSVGYGGRDPDGNLRVIYKSSDLLGAPEISASMQRASIDTPLLPLTNFTMVGISFAQTMTLPGSIDVRYGAELEGTSDVGRSLYVDPFAKAAWKLSDASVISYQLSWAGQQQDATPRLSVASGALALERGKHQEAAFAHKFGIADSILVGFYRDSFSNLALLGMGQMDAAGPDLADNVLAGSDLESFTANAGRFNAQGMHASWTHKFGANQHIGAHYSYGTVLDSNLARYAQIAGLQQGLQQEYRSEVGVNGGMKWHGSEARGSYNRTIGMALTPVDAFDAASVESAPYLNLQLRQRLPSVLPAKMEAVVEMRNLLAQGYRPVLGEDGRVLFLVQEPRSLRGGIAFNF